MTVDRINQQRCQNSYHRCASYVQKGKGQYKHGEGRHRIYLKGRNKETN